MHTRLIPHALLTSPTSSAASAIPSHLAAIVLFMLVIAIVLVVGMMKMTKRIIEHAFSFWEHLFKGAVFISVVLIACVGIDIVAATGKA
jgi:hypothetical protein